MKKIFIFSFLVLVLFLCLRVPVSCATFQSCEVVVEPSVTPTEEVTPTPTEEITPSPTEEVTPTPEPEVTPEPTEAPREEPKQESSSNSVSQPSAPQACVSRKFSIIPTVWGVGRIDSDTVYARWTNADEGVDTYVVWYGTEKDDLKWNGTFKGNYAELNGVPNTHIWISVQATDGCGTGTRSFPIDP